MSYDFNIKGDPDTHIRVRVFGYAHPGSWDVFDANWLSSRVIIHDGSFDWDFEACFLTGELESLRSGLATLVDHDDKMQSFVYQPLEDALNLTFKLEQDEHMSVRGYAQDGMGDDHDLEFRTDCARLKETVEELAEVVKWFPDPRRYNSQGVRRRVPARPDHKALGIFGKIRNWWDNL